MPRRPATRHVRYPDLATYVAETGVPQATIAHAVGISQAHISRIVAGAAIPRPALARRLARVCRIPLESFTRRYLEAQGGR